MSYVTSMRSSVNNLLAQQGFKLAVLIFLFILIALRVITIFYYPGVDIFSVGWSLTVALVCIGYLWIAELRDRARLERINRELIITKDILKESELDAIMALILSQEAKDPYSYGHTNRVTKYSVSLARELRLPLHTVDVIERAAKLHDIGKIGIKDSILFFEGRLSAKDYEVIKSHPVKSVTILEPLKFIDEEKRIILHHHERYDGKGYPEGIKMDQIPLGSRILAIADSFDAMSSDRVYRKRLSKSVVIKELKENSGTQFDPHLVKVFLTIINRFYA
ncbi:MAG: HD-GYP domain-containing protein [Candidatus Omnitrophica bacterium]|nr:HD-GYP domain-containing protein [Candidatus Omnitrophota bacterium]